VTFPKQYKAFSLLEVSAVILIIGILVAGVVTANSLIDKSRLASAKTLTTSSSVNGVKDLALWLETSADSSFDEADVGNGNTINKWNDLKKSAAAFSVAKVGAGPIYSNTINSIHAVKFAGNSSDYLQISDASFLNNTDYTIFVLEKRLAAGTNYFLGSTASNANDKLALGYASDSTVTHEQGSNVYSAPASVSGYSDSSGKARIFTFVQDSTDGKRTYINGTLTAQSSDTARLSGVTNLEIGKKLVVKNLTQTTTANQPTIAVSGAVYKIGGTPTLYHDVSNDGMGYGGSAYLNSNPLTVNVVTGSNANNNGARRSVQGSNNWLIGPYGNVNAWYANGWNYNAVTWPLTSLQVITVIQPLSAANTAWRNGASVAAGNSKGVPGRINTGTVGSYFEPLDGYVSEVIVFSTDITTTDRQKLENNQLDYC